MGHCQLHQWSIDCPEASYQRVQNKPIKLTETPPQSMLRSPEKADLSSPEHMVYLTKNYTIYIKKMLSLGLGDSTMSLTKFNHLLKASIQNDTDFSERFNQIFQQLEKDKQSLGIKSSYQSAAPADIKNCWILTGRIIICDNIQRNWVYIKRH